MARRSYEQLCALARALDVVGERWTLLLVRELLFGPRRFGELEEALPGIGPNLLSARVKALAEEGVIRRVALRTDARGGGIGYELTEQGRELEPVLLALARWELSRAAEVPELAAEAAGAGAEGGPDGILPQVRPEWAILALRARFAAGSSSGLSESYQVEMGDRAFRFEVRDGHVEATAGRDPNAAVTVRADAATIARIALGGMSLEQAAAAGRVQLAGSPFAAARFARVFDLERGAAA